MVVFISESEVTERMEELDIENGDRITYQNHIWDPTISLPNTPINNIIMNQKGFVENFNGTILTAVAVWFSESQSPIHSFKVVKGELQFDQGWCVSMLNDLAYMLNFTVKALKSNVYSTELQNGTLIGPGGLVVSGDADLYMGFIGIFANTMRDLIPVHPMGYYRLSAFLLQPKIGGVRNIFLQPFQTICWILIFITVIILTLSTLICCMFEKKYLQEKYHLFDTVAWISGIALSQSFFDPETLSLRIIFVAALSTTLLLTNSYSAFLISFLATDYVPITTPKDIAKFKYNLISDDRNSYACKSIYTNEKVLQKYCDTSQYIGEEDAIQKVYGNRRRRYAFIKTLDFICVTAWKMKFTNQDICTASEIPLNDKIPVTSMYGLRKSPLISILNSKLIKLQERGVNPRYSNLYDQQTKIKCDRSQKFTYDPDVEVADLYIAFCILLFGFMISCVAWTGENLVCRMIQWKLQKESNLPKNSKYLVAVGE